MMSLHVSGALGHAFRGSTDAAAYRESLRRHQQAENERRERLGQVASNAESEQAEIALAVIVTAGELEEFRLELDGYETATVVALEHNELELKLVRERMDKLLGDAHVLPDGRRVFKTKDGLRVFDENGMELGGETIDPDMIENARPYWETYKPELETKLRLEAERRELIHYQEQLDEARQRVNAGEISRDDFDTMKADLVDSMPDAVRANVPGLAEEPQKLAASTVPSQAVELEISDDIVPGQSHVPRPRG